MDASSNNIPIEYKMRVTETFTETFTDTFTETLHKLRRIWQALFFVTVQDLVPGTLQLLKISELHESILHQCQSSAIQLVEVQKNEEQKTENHTLQPHFAGFQWHWQGHLLIAGKCKASLHLCISLSSRMVGTGDQTETALLLSPVPPQKTNECQRTTKNVT